MVRDVDALTNTPFDLLVAGGGIHGLFAAYDAAQRGLSVALVERGDFGSGLSSNHQRTIHGGLRALQRANLAKTRQQIDERRTWARIAPHLIAPLPFIVGTYGWTRQSRLALRAGLAVYDRVGRARNAQVPVELHLPRTRLESAATTRRLSAGIVEQGLTGGAIWYDYQTRFPDRLTWTVALAAERAGARLVNYAALTAPVRDAAGALRGAHVTDVETGRALEVAARAILVAAGSAMGDLLQRFGATGAPPLLRAMNVLLNRPARDIATAARGSSGRMLTAVPWHGRLLVGTDQSREFVTPPEDAPPPGTVEAFLADANSAFPKLGATLRDVTLVHHGLVPALSRNGHADLLPEPRIARHEADGAPALVSLVGAKYTTARWAAEQAVNLICAALGRPAGRCRTGQSPLPHAGIADVEGLLTEAERGLHVEIDRDVREHLSGWYGTEAASVLRYSVERHLQERLSGETAVLAGEIAYAVEHAAARRLSDAILRRTSLGLTGHPGQASLRRAAEVMGRQLSWDAGRVAEEIARVEAVYPDRSDAGNPTPAIAPTAR
jgi:glycerol-3-phosphate dehydrogenase